MGVLYMPYFDVSSTEFATFGSITLDDGVNADVVVDISALSSPDQSGDGFSSIYNHKGGSLINTVVGGRSGSDTIFPHYSSLTFAVALQTELRAQAFTSTWTSPNSLSVTFSTATARYTISHPSVSFSIAWSSDATRRLLGFSGASSSALSHTGTLTPLFCVSCTLLDVSRESDFYEPDGIGNHITADGGRGTGISRTEAPKYKDWVQEFETKYKTHRLYGVASEFTDPFTHEHLREYCRGEWPFVLYGDDRDGAFGIPEVYYLRTDGISFRPERATPGNDAQFHIPYACELAGTVGVDAP